MILPVINLTAQERDTAARTLSGEADDQGREGKIWVAWTIRNRATWRPAAWWGAEVGKCCLHPWQFSCWVTKFGDQPNADLARIRALTAADACYRESLEVVDAVMSGQIPDPTGGSTSYKVKGTDATWDFAVQDVEPRACGDHLFWRLAPQGHCEPFLENGGINV